MEPNEKQTDEIISCSFDVCVVNLVFTLGERGNTAFAPVAHGRLPKWRDDGREFPPRFVGWEVPMLLDAFSLCRAGKVMAMSTGGASPALNTGWALAGPLQTTRDPRCAHGETSPDASTLGLPGKPPRMPLP